MLHDFVQRTAWDKGVARARLEGGTAAGRGARTACLLRLGWARLAVSFEYLTFKDGVLAVIQMIKRPPGLAAMTVTIQHKATRIGYSQITYAIVFATAPRALALFMEPMAAALIRWQTRSRLAELKRYLESGPDPSTAKARRLSGVAQ